MPPTVSLLVAMRNEEKHIAGCLRSILAQDYPAASLEIIVADGRSSDRSREIVRETLAGRPNGRLIDNPDRVQSAAWNLGIAAATGEIVGIVSAHSELAPDYVRQAVDTIERTGADLVGGPMTAVGTTTVARAVALATSSRFGVGGASFHYATSEHDVDTVYLGLCRRDLYARIGGFDPGMVRNQDDELSYRLLDAGGRIVCNPAIRSRYFNRATFRGLARQYFEYGCWKVRVMQKHPRQMRARHFAPMMLVGAVAAGLVLSLVSSVAAIATVALGAVYLLGLVVATLANASGRDPAASAVMPLVFPVLHFCYGAGFWRGLAVFGLSSPRDSGRVSQSVGS